MSENSKTSVLLVEDNPVEAMLMQRVLTKATEPTYDVLHVDSLGKGFEVLSNGKYLDIILLDLSLPDSEGIETFLKMHQKAPQIPTVVLTGTDSDEFAIEALRRGAQDYLVKSDADSKIILRVMQYAIERKRIERELTQTHEALEKDEKMLQDMLASLKRSNEQLRATQLQLIQAEKLEVVGRLAAGVAHEVKNPLAMIRMGIDFFKRKQKEDNHKYAFMMKSMLEALTRADNVIQEMLDFSSLQYLERIECNLNEIIRASIQLVRPELEKTDVTINADLDPDIGSVLLDRTRFEQVLVNLLMNSLHAMEGKGEIQVSNYKKELTEVGGIVGYRKEDVFEPGDRVIVIEIKDNGPGIPEDVLPKIFDPFFTTKRTEGGTGLGLSIVKSIMQLHNGSIEITNNKEGGAHITLMLKIK